MGRGKASPDSVGIHGSGGLSRQHSSFPLCFFFRRLQNQTGRMDREDGAHWCRSSESFQARGINQWECHVLPVSIVSGVQCVRKRLSRKRNGRKAIGSKSRGKRQSFSPKESRAFVSPSLNTRKPPGKRASGTVREKFIDCLITFSEMRRLSGRQ